MYSRVSLLPINPVSALMPFLGDALSSVTDKSIFMTPHSAGDRSIFHVRLSVVRPWLILRTGATFGAVFTKRKQTFYEIAIDHELSSAEAAENIYKKELTNLLKK